MARACRKLAGELMFFAESSRPAVRVLCGPGNNGGDGFGMAWQLHQAGWPVEIWLCVPPEKIQGDALSFFQLCEAVRVPIQQVLETEDWERMARRVPPRVWWIDALLGTGSREAPRGNLAQAVRFLKAQEAANMIWAVDLPTGLDADTGTPFDASLCVRADHTLTLGGPKAGFAQDASDAWTGAISVLDLGFAADVLSANSDGGTQALSDQQAADCLRSSPRAAHKGSQGHALLIGGSPGMSGAISLSARAALASGCGLVSVLAPYSCAPLIDSMVPEAMVIYGLQGKFASLCSQEIHFCAYQALGVGPGLRVNVGTYEMLFRILKECTRPLVLDADALTQLAAFLPEQREVAAPLWLTPHPGEMSRLLKCTSADVQSARSGKVRECSDEFRAHVVLKGARSRMAQPESSSWLNLNGNPGMATGGSGDVLTGLLTGLIARGVDRGKVLPLAVYLHGRAGDLAAHRKGQSGMKAGDVVEAIPEVLRHLQGR